MNDTSPSPIARFAAHALVALLGAALHAYLDGPVARFLSAPDHDDSPFSLLGI